MKDYGKAVRKLRRENGCDTPFTVPTTINSRHTANKILRDAGLEKAF